MTEYGCAVVWNSVFVADKRGRQNLWLQVSSDDPGANPSVKLHKLNDTSHCWNDVLSKRLKKDMARHAANLSLHSTKLWLNTFA